MFSASNDVFNLLVRALKAQGRIDILSRPQIMTLDNQAASLQVGSSVPYTAGTSTAAATTVTTTTYLNIGVLLNIVPKINPDGKVTMRVTPTVSKLNPSLDTAGLAAPAYDTQTIDTTIIAHDGETVAIGGLIKRNDAKTENKVPWLGDLPWVGALFRYRQQIKSKQELLIVLTPHIVRNRFEADRILAMEGARMDWITSDVIKTQGIAGMDPLFPLPKGVDAPLPPPSRPSPSITPSMQDVIMFPPPSFNLPDGLPTPRSGPSAPGAGPDGILPARARCRPAPRSLGRLRRARWEDLLVDRRWHRCRSVPARECRCRPRESPRGQPWITLSPGLASPPSIRRLGIRPASRPRPWVPRQLTPTIEAWFRGG